MSGETITVVTDSPGGVDDYGDPLTPASTSNAQVDDVYAAPRRGVDTDDQGRGGIVLGYTLYRVPAFTVTSGSRIVFRGATWEVEGEPGEWRSPWSGATGTEVDIRRAEG